MMVQNIIVDTLATKYLVWKGDVGESAGVCCRNLPYAIRAETHGWVAMDHVGQAINNKDKYLKHPMITMQV